MTRQKNMVLKSAGLIFLSLATASLPVTAQTSAPQRAHSAELRRAANRGYLGVGVVELTDERVQALKLKDDQGVEVKRVEDNSPAAKAGLKNNDVILEVNGKSIDGLETFLATVGDTQPGTKINLTIWRDGAKKTLAATLDSRPDNFFYLGGPDLPNPPTPPMPPAPYGNGFPGLPADSPRVGFEGEPVNGQLADFFGVKQGVLVRSVNADTPASHAGLKAGDVVTKVNGTPVTSPREITGLVRMSGKKEISFTVVRNKKEMTLKVEVAQIQDRQQPAQREVL
jgi:serine protease Do